MNKKRLYVLAIIIVISCLLVGAVLYLNGQSKQDKSEELDPDVKTEEADMSPDSTTEFSMPFVIDSSAESEALNTSAPQPTSSTKPMQTHAAEVSSTPKPAMDPTPKPSTVVEPVSDLTPTLPPSIDPVNVLGSNELPFVPGP